jgi:hypothetical protein
VYPDQDSAAELPKHPRLSPPKEPYQTRSSYHVIYSFSALFIFCIFIIFSCSPRLVRVRRWKLHASSQPKWVGVEHGIVGIEEVRHIAEHGAYAIRVRRCKRSGRCVRRVLRGWHGRLHTLRLHRRRWERLRERTRASAVVAGLLILEDIGLLVVFLLCTHGN